MSIEMFPRLRCDLGGTLGTESFLYPEVLLARVVSHPYHLRNAMTSTTAHRLLQEPGSRQENGVFFPSE